MPVSTTSLLPLEKYYPVLTLPTEITSAIFTHFLPLYPSCPPLTGLESPNLLTHICHDWREIALRTPRLWRAIPIFDPRVEQHLEWVCLWLQRSQPMPLSLHIWSPYRPLPNSAITAIIPHRHRYASLVLYFAQASAVAALDGPMPLLEHLDLSITDKSSGVVFNEAPLLLRGAYLVEELALSSLLNMRDSTTLPRLESLKIRVTILGAPLGSPSLILPALRHLAVEAARIGPEIVGDIGSLTNFMENARCSRLAQLSITGPPSAQSLEDTYRTAFPSVSVTFNRRR
ncbi:hypothetical protein B0H16DRAFT_1846056 [Mycena metata]|uniref:F-box domain-containing protein n=1 Tax=Mycena metata TaxID=1033252 RepID=A0AAD7K4D1_9AGAR|nr:hypothetical protein B0H16DRAFT_1846056 [Mycena metata]